MPLIKEIIWCIWSIRIYEHVIIKSHHKRNEFQAINWVRKDKTGGRLKSWLYVPMSQLKMKENYFTEKWTKHSKKHYPNTCEWWAFGVMPIFISKETELKAQITVLHSRDWKKSVGLKIACVYEAVKPLACYGKYKLL